MSILILEVLRVVLYFWLVLFSEPDVDSLFDEVVCFSNFFDEGFEFYDQSVKFLLFDVIVAE